MVLNFVKGLVKNSAVAEDIAQNTFVKLWLNRFSLQQGQSVKNYLCVLSRNESINFLRSGKARNIPMSLHNDSCVQNPNIEDWMSFVETSSIIRANIEALPPQRKAIFMMSRYEHMSNMEIAVKLNLSVRTVEKHIELALKDLRHSMS
jgi:RNA polymerase sigma-70 factor (ECF subfamily)